MIGDDPLMVEAMNTKLLDLGGHGSPSGLVMRAIAGIDIAPWGLKGKAFNQRVYKLLGGHHHRVPTYTRGHLWRSYSAGGLAQKGFATLCQIEER